MSKSILFLGAGQDQIRAIKYAKEQGYYVITCDYLPQNPGHKYGDEYHNINTTDKEAVLQLAKKLNIDGVLSFGTDANAPTQAFVENELGIPSNPYESILVLTRKDLLRSFLKEHDFYTPKSEIFLNYDALNNYTNRLIFPIIVKPVDGSGSNGVSKVNHLSELKKAFEYAMQFSRNKRVIIEDFLNIDGAILDGDGFIIDGKIVFYCFGDTVRSDLVNTLVPLGITLPSKLCNERMLYAKSEIERLFTLLNMKSGPFNVEFGFDKSGNFIIIDIGPRNGGLSVPMVIKHATGIDLIKYVVDFSLGIDCGSLAMNEVNAFVCEYRVPSHNDGIFMHIQYNNQIEKNIIEEHISVQTGDKVKKMSRAADRLGLVYFKFKTATEMNDKMKNIDKYYKIIVE